MCDTLTIFTTSSLKGNYTQSTKCVLLFTLRVNRLHCWFWWTASRVTTKTCLVCRYYVGHVSDHRTRWAYVGEVAVTKPYSEDSYSLVSSANTANFE